MPRGDEPLVAYFCAEYGFHESFPIYSGGLGVLAGDYCKAASDGRASFVAVGLLYEQGYFTQTVDNDGVQHAEYREHDPRDLPVEAARNSSGQWIKVTVRIAGRDVVARLWKAQVGRVPVYLLDTNTPENAPTDRDITHRLYGGDESTRVRQEMVLGIGGVRALRALGIKPAVWHLNEGHAAFRSWSCCASIWGSDCRSSPRSKPSPQPAYSPRTLPLPPATTPSDTTSS